MSDSFLYRWFGGWVEAFASIRDEKEAEELYERKRQRLKSRLATDGQLWVSAGDQPEIVEHVRKLGAYLTNVATSETDKDKIRLLFQEWQRGIRDDQNAHYNAVRALDA